MAASYEEAGEGRDAGRREEACGEGRGLASPCVAGAGRAILVAGSSHGAYQDNQEASWAAQVGRMGSLWEVHLDERRWC